VDNTRITDGQSRGRLQRLLLCVSILACGLATSLPAQSAAPRVALVLDQQNAGSQPQVAAAQREIQGFFRPGEITLLPPLAGDGTVAGVSRALDRALRDSSVSVVVALGPIGSHLLAHGGEPRKPSIAATIVDGRWQGIPDKDGTSGLRNLVYVDESYALSGTVAAFHGMIPFRRMAVLLDPELLAVIPELAGNVRYLVSGANAGAVVVPARVEPILSLFCDFKISSSVLSPACPMTPQVGMPRTGAPTQPNFSALNLTARSSSACARTCPLFQAPRVRPSGAAL